jgi:hypothetical protein
LLVVASIAVIAQVPTKTVCARVFRSDKVLGEIHCRRALSRDAVLDQVQASAARIERLTPAEVH